MGNGAVFVGALLVAPSLSDAEGPRHSPSPGTGEGWPKAGEGASYSSGPGQAFMPPSIVVTFVKP